MRALFFFLKFCVLLSMLCASMYFGGNIIINISDFSLEIQAIHLVLILIILVCVYELLALFFSSLLKLIRGKPSHVKGLESLQKSFSGVLLKDKKSAEKNIKKAKKYLGDIPLVNWLEGQLMIIKNEYSQAKSIFYELCTKEKDTAIGAHSLFKMALHDKSENDALVTINKILKISPDSLDIAFHAIVLALKNKDFIEAKKHIHSIKKSKKGKLVEAIIYFNEGVNAQDIDSMKKAFKLAPELTENAIRYADVLISEEKYKDARKVLIKSFVSLPTFELYEKYISLGRNLSEKTKFAEKIMKEESDSWIVYFGLAKLAMENGFIQLAFQNFLKAYNKKQYNFVAEGLLESVKMLPDPKPKEAIDISESALASNRVEFLWRCENCGIEEKNWTDICKHCNRVGECAPLERVMNAHHFLEN